MTIGVVAALTGACAARPPQALQTPKLSQPCSELRVEPSEAGFWIEKPPCPDGGLTIPRQLVVPPLRRPHGDTQ